MDTISVQLARSALEITLIQQRQRRTVLRKRGGTQFRSSLGANLFTVRQTIFANNNCQYGTGRWHARTAVRSRMGLPPPHPLRAAEVESVTLGPGLLPNTCDAIAEE